MIDPTADEKAALQHASTVAGEYVESIRKSEPFAALSYEEWMTFVEVMVTAYLDQVLDPEKEVPGCPI